MRFSLAFVAAANLLAIASAAPAEAAAEAKLGTAGGLEANSVAGTYSTLDTSTGQSAQFCGNFSRTGCARFCGALGYPYYQCLYVPDVCRCLF